MRFVDLIMVDGVVQYQDEVRFFRNAFQDGNRWVAEYYGTKTTAQIPTSSTTERPEDEEPFDTVITSNELKGLFTANEYTGIRNAAKDPSNTGPQWTELREMIERLDTRDIDIDTQDPASRYQAGITILRNLSLISPRRMRRLRRGLPIRGRRQ